MNRLSRANARDSRSRNFASFPGRPKIRGASEESFRLIVETIPGLVAVMTPAGDVEHVNGQVLEYFGRTLDELKHWGTSDAVHPGDLPRVLAAWQHAVETGQFISIRQTRHPDSNRASARPALPMR